MKYLNLLIISVAIISCNDQRSGLPKDARNYTDQVFNEGDSLCMRDQFGLFQFHHINADTVAKTIFSANRKYFGEAFDTKEIRNSISTWLTDDFFTTKTYSDINWKLYYPTDRSKFTGNYKTMHGLESFGINLYIENLICLRKLVGNDGVYKYTEVINNTSYSESRNKLRFLCDFHIDFRYRPKSLFIRPKTEYYRVTITDTVDLFTMLGDSSFVYR